MIVIFTTLSIQILAHGMRLDRVRGATKFLDKNIVLSNVILFALRINTNGDD